MTRRTWNWTLTLGWLASLVPACQHTVAVLPDDPRPTVASSTPVRRTQEITHIPPMPQRPSIPNPPDPPQGEVKVEPIEQTHYPMNQQERSTDRRPGPLLEPPGPFRQVPRQEPASPAPAPLAVPAVEDSPLVAALRCYLNKQPAEALAWLERYDRSNQELLLVLLPLAARLSEAKLQELSPREAGAMLAQLDGLMRPLRAEAALMINKICFCKQIKKFGDYEPLPDDYAFRPGEPVYVYLELQNFSTKPEGIDYVIPLASHMEILEYNRKVVWHSESPEIQDRSRTMRHDYCPIGFFCVPQDLRPGQYTLRVQITDLPTKRTAERTLDFQVTKVASRSVQ